MRNDLLITMFLIVEERENIYEEFKATPKAYDADTAYAAALLEDTQANVKLAVNYENYKRMF